MVGRSLDYLDSPLLSFLAAAPDFLELSSCCCAVLYLPRTPPTLVQLWASKPSNIRTTSYSIGAQSVNRPFLYVLHQLTASTAIRAPLRHSSAPYPSFQAFAIHSPPFGQLFRCNLPFERVEMLCARFSIPCEGLKSSGSLFC